MAKLFNTRSLNAGAPAGTISAVDPDTQQIDQLTFYRWDQHQAEKGSLELSNFTSPTEDSTHCYWFNACGLAGDQLGNALGEVLGIHSLSVEDIQNIEQRPKYESYADYALFMLKMLRHQVDRPQYEQLSILVGPNYLFTIQQTDGDVFDPLRTRIENGSSKVMGRSIDYALFAMLDAVVDHYMLTLDQLGGDVDEIEELIYETSSNEILNAIRSYKSDVTLMRHYVSPLKEAVRRYIRDEERLVSSNAPYFRNLIDHLNALSGAVQSYSEILNNQFTSYTAIQSSRLSDIMKVLTVISTIFIPLTFLAGIYGMNFAYMPELRSKLGYPVVLIAMAIIAAGLMWYFRMKGWIGPTTRKTIRSRRFMGRSSASPVVNGRKRPPEDA